MSTITDQIAAAVAARKDSLKVLRERIAAILAPIPAGVVLSDDNGEVCRIVRACAGASQWANRTWDVTIYGWAAIGPSGRFLCDAVEDGKWVNSNLHYRKTGISRREGEAAIKPETGAVTRALAARLPRAIERYMTECAAETAANTTAADQLTA